MKNKTAAFGLLVFLNYQISQVTTTYIRNKHFDGCEPQVHKDICSANKNGKPKKIIKSDTSQFKRCPGTSRVCLEGGSEVNMNFDSRIFITDYANLEIFENASLNVFNDGVCRIMGNSYLAIRSTSLGNKPKLVINNGTFKAMSRSEFAINGGAVFIDHQCQVNISQHSKFMLEGSNSESTTIRFGPNTNFDLAFFSTSTIVKGGQLKTIGTNEIKIRFYSTLDINNGEIWMDQRSEANTEDRSILKIGDYWCSSNPQYSAKLLLGLDSVLKLYTQSEIRILNGQMIINDASRLDVSNGGKIFVNGLLEIRGIVSIISKGEIFVGDNVHDCHNNNNASLVISENVISMKITVPLGVHCFSKQATSYNRREEIILNSRSNTDKFKCFNNRDALMAALEKN